MARAVKELGVPEKIIGKMVVTPPSDVVWLGADDLRSMGVTMIGKPAQIAPDQPRSAQTPYPLPSAPRAVVGSLIQLPSAPRTTESTQQLPSAPRSDAPCPAAPPSCRDLDDADAAYARRDYATALRLYRPLAARDDYAAEVAQMLIAQMYRFGQGVTRNFAEAAKWYRPLAEKGLDEAQFALGMIYATGGSQVPQNFAEAHRWYLRAADHGHAEAQARLGVLFAEQVPPNLTEAHKWEARAAQQGNGGAQVFLGVEYAGGWGGVTQDYVEAHKWFNLAAARSEEEKGRVVATTLRDKVAAKMTAEQIAVAQKLAREWAPKLER
jgi:hypothetical protein